MTSLAIRLLEWAMCVLERGVVACGEAALALRARRGTALDAALVAQVERLIDEAVDEAERRRRRES